MLNIGDVIFQLFSFLVVIFIAMLILFMIRSFSQRKKQLDRIEEKLDIIVEQAKKDRSSKSN